MKNTESITLGVGDLFVNGQDLGYLGGDVTVNTETEKVDFTHGTHKTLVKRFVTTLARSIKASIAQLDMETLQLALGIGEVVQVGNNKRMNFGNNWQLAVLHDVKFVHTRDDGKKITIFFPKAQVEPGSSELKFSADNVIMQDITITALEDPERRDCPMGFIQVGDNDDTNEAGGGPGGPPQGGPHFVDNEIVTGEAEETWYNYTLSHHNVSTEPAPVVTNEAGNVTYTAGVDYYVDFNEGIISTNGCEETSLTNGDNIKVSYSFND